MINIGMIAKQYGQLPSTVRELGTTYDLMIYDVMMSWEQYQQEKAEGKTQTPNLSQEQMMAMMEKVKNKDKEKL
jgi:hypothetical protein